MQAVLEQGTITLKDAAVSGNGCVAATLSHTIFDGRRRVQLWTLNDKSKIGEIFCPEEVESIHVSDSGCFILGLTSISTWVYDRETNTDTWYDEFFISNQRGKVSFYGDKVIRKDDRKCLYLCDLVSGESKKLDNFGEDAVFACILQDGSAAVVGKDCHHVVLKNSGDGRRSEVNSQPSKVIGVHGIKDKPFIAVATADDMISVYHTRTLQRTRKIVNVGGNKLMVMHPYKQVIANSGGSHR